MQIEGWELRGGLDSKVKSYPLGVKNMVFEIRLPALSIYVGMTIFTSFRSL